ncbi:UMP-CMP kinase-like [Porites lutea]|uniref:UMP-CMP kinase-like n=1 Tax=Porites lutea TaxID=51062 RepID=UPI003CC6BFAE
MYKRAAGRFNLLRRIRPLIDKSSAEKIYKAMIQPVFTYCGTLGLGWSHSRKSRIESIERRSQKVIGGNYQVQTVESLIKRQSCQLVFDCLQDNEFGYIHLSAGELLRVERASGSENGDLIETCMKEGKIVPVEITISLIEKAMNKSNTKRFLIDGFPRNENNLHGWHKVMDGKADVKCVLFFECTEEECIKRIMLRGESSGRPDDNIESLKKRFHTYETQTMPIIQHYEKLGLVKKIQAIKSPEQVFEEVQNALTSLGD